jgi:MFS family permease
MTGVSTLIQERSPNELRGRIMALWMMGFVGSRPLAAAVVGSAADLFSVRASFVVAAVLLGLIALLCRPRVLGDPRPSASESLTATRQEQSVAMRRA